LIILGDIHGHTQGGFDHLKWLLKTRISDSNIIQVGDFGLTRNIRYMVRTLLELNEALGETGNKMYVCRGNHDNPAFWNGTHLYENIELVPDYDTRVIEGKTILFIGGAISVDRKDRIDTGNVWFPDEGYVLRKDKLATFKDVDIVVTHTAPKFAFPQTLSGIPENYIKADHTLLQECARERMDLTETYDILKENNNITNWVYGHFHTNEVTFHDGIEFRVVGIKDTHHLRTEAEYGN